MKTFSDPNMQRHLKRISEVRIARRRERLCRHAAERNAMQLARAAEGVRTGGISSDRKAAAEQAQEKMALITDTLKKSGLDKLATVFTRMADRLMVKAEDAPAEER
jgi:hypothetical protein